MKNKYSEEKIAEIKDYIKKHGYATNFIEPSFYLLTTVFIFFLLLYLIHITKNYNPIFILLLSLIILRLFMIFHDMGHKSFFPTDERKNNYKGFKLYIARCIDQWLFFPADYWSDGHSNHHKAHGNMNEYDSTRTVLKSSEYDNLDPIMKILYGVSRFPVLFFFLLCPIYVYWISPIINGNWLYLIKYILWLFILFKIGSWKLLLSFLIAQYITGVIGLMLFHLQHQVNIGYWKKFDISDKLSKDNAELLGASVQKIPFWLEYFTNGIEYHNIHHLDPGIPSYTMKQIYYELLKNGLSPDEKIGYLQEFESLGYTIFNEKTQRYE
jgi:omega-6 fatty acid desaturase (delta-12 desaturase)